ncbi:MAG: hypothetical protein R3325_14995, partial [Thermoanaerobaculia bacterium]|nr:hypothetical protein [Thermoanaerobaculia bacterium]
PGRKNWDPREEPDAGAPPVAMRGDWLYMVDIETGRTVYKRQLLVEIDDEHRSAGPAPGGAAAVDTDQDGYLDRVYLGTVGGYLFRVDLHLESDGDAHSLVDHTVQSTKVDDDGNPVTFTVRRFPLTSGGQPVWEPRAIFTTNFDGGSATTLPRPIYHEPAVIFAAELGRYALAFGTGDREDLWSGNTQSGRFYVFVDETDLLLDSALPQTENDFVGLAANSPDIGPNLLTSRGVGQRGWYLILDDEERVISDAFSLAGVTFFSSYQPDVLVTSGQNPLCSKTGGSRIFIVNTTNGNSFVEVAGVRSRFLLASSFVTQPYTEQGGNANPPTGSGNEPPTPTADDLTDQLRQVMEEMKSLFPPECKFANYRIDIKTLKADTGVVFIAPVPVCLIEKNWREF